MSTKIGSSMSLIYQNDFMILKESDKANIETSILDDARNNVFLIMSGGFNY